MEITVQLRDSVDKQISTQITMTEDGLLTETYLLKRVFSHLLNTFIGWRLEAGGRGHLK